MAIHFRSNGVARTHLQWRLAFSPTALWTMWTNRGQVLERLRVVVRHQQGFRKFDILVRDQEVEGSNHLAPTTSFGFN